MQLYENRETKYYLTHEKCINILKMCELSESVKNSIGKLKQRINTNDTFDIEAARLLLKHSIYFEEFKSNPQIALVFKGNSKQRRIYDLKSVELVASNKNHIVNINKKIEEFKSDNKSENFYLTAIHNHAKNTTFTFEDVACLLHYDCIHELFIDSKDYVQILIKTKEASLKSFSEKQVKNYVKLLDDFIAKISISNIEEYRKVLLNGSKDEIDAFTMKLHNEAFNELFSRNRYSKIIQEIINFNLDYTENVMLCHAIISLYNTNTIDIHSITSKIQSLAMELSSKYPEPKYIDDLLMFVDTLFTNECDSIRQKSIIYYRFKKSDLSMISRKGFE